MRVVFPDRNNTYGLAWVVLEINHRVKLCITGDYDGIWLRAADGAAYTTDEYGNCPWVPLLDGDKCTPVDPAWASDSCPLTVCQRVTYDELFAMVPGDAEVAEDWDEALCYARMDSERMTQWDEALAELDY
jgi:hypothetical protein